MNSLEKIFLSLDERTLILTPNRRLTNYLISQFDISHANRNEKAWFANKIFPFANWLETLWNNSISEKILLNENQESLLWEQIISDHHNEFTNSKQKLAFCVKQAFDTIHLWDLTLDNFIKHVNDNHITSLEIRSFIKWAKVFQKILLENKFLINSTLPKTLCSIFENNNHLFSATNKILMVGFEMNFLPPAYNKLLNIIQSFDCKILSSNCSTQASTQSSLAFQTQKDEIITMMRWAKGILEANPQANIGCIVPDLTLQRYQIERLGVEVFDSAFFLRDPRKINNLPFNISIGKKLAEYPIIKHALHLLESNHDHTNVAAGCQKFSRWKNTFISILQASNWPPENELTSLEYQCVHRFYKLLDEFAALDLVLKNVIYSVAITRLQSLAFRTIFQPKSEPKQINILGLLEAQGMNFDYLWVAGMHNENFPSAPKLNPFIPIGLQKKLSMPHSSAIKEFEFAASLFTHLKQSATNVIFSYTKQADDCNLLPSPLIKDIPSISISDLKLAEFSEAKKTIYQSKNLREFHDYEAPSVSTLEAENLSGRADILKYQAECPFRAFATFRLKAKPKIDSSKFIRGLVVHKALELLWQELKDQRSLLALADDDLGKLISLAIDQAMLKITKEKKYNFGENFHKAEKKCLEKLIFDWLSFEKNRHNFEVIATEKQITTHLGKLKLNLRADRIDKEQGQSLVVIDYKTGKKQPKIDNWFGDRPEEPQLPLYCLTSGEKIEGIMFAAVNTKDKKKLKGKTKSENPEEWQQMLNEWQTNLTKLAMDFYEGNAKINPKNEKETCKFCDLAILCRTNKTIQKK
jgi:hypothetical protein